MPTAKSVTALLVLSFVGLSLGCSYKRGQGWEFHPVKSLVGAVVDDAVDRESELDRLVEQGYGFNNPNAKRRPEN